MRCKTTWRLAPHAKHALRFSFSFGSVFRYAVTAHWGAPWGRTGGRLRARSEGRTAAAARAQQTHRVGGVHLHDPAATRPLTLFCAQRHALPGSYSRIMAGLWP